MTRWVIKHWAVYFELERFLHHLDPMKTGSVPERCSCTSTTALEIPPSEGRPFPSPIPAHKSITLARTGCLLWHDFAGPAHITADSSGLGTECNCCCFIGMRAWACPSAEQGWLWLCAGYHALYQTGAVSKFIHFPGWLCATSYPKWYHCILQLSLKCW